MFHDVLPDGAPLPDEYACHLSGLLHSVEAHQKSGFTFLSMDALLAMPWREARYGKCVLTFDDGCESMSRVAVPALVERGVPFTMYMATSLLDRPGYISADRLAELSDLPLCTIGSHMVSHSMTRFLPKKEVTRELLESREVLEAVTGKQIRHLAFPYGSAYACSLRDVRLAGKSGYASAVLTTPTPLYRLRLYPNFSMPRLNMPMLGENP